MGMTVNQLLARMDSRELSERMILDNLDWWRKRQAEKDVDMSKRLMSTLFGKALAKGVVKWQERTK